LTHSNKALREIANLVLIMGNREIIDSMAPGSVKVMDQVLKLIDAYDLYGSVAYPKQHTQNDISDIYLLPAATRGVFVNIALQVGGGALTGAAHAQLVSMIKGYGYWQSSACIISLVCALPGAKRVACFSLKKPQHQLHGKRGSWFNNWTAGLCLLKICTHTFCCALAGALWPDPDRGSSTRRPHRGHHQRRPS
jgi:hypothetical protein